MNSVLTIEKPYRLCYDVSGIVAAVGGGVTKFKAGDEVYSRVAHDRMGTLSTYTLTPQSTIAFKPKSLSHDQAAAVPLAGLTALQALRDVGKAKSADKILILGASEVVTTVSAEGASLARELGATQTIDYKKEKFNETVKNVDLCLDTTGEANSAFSTLRQGGTVVSIITAPTVAGMTRSGIEVGLATQAFLTAASAPVLANAAIHGGHYEWLFMKPSGAELTEFAQWIDSGKIKPVIDRTYTFTQYKEAFEYLEAGHAKGKVIIHVADEKHT
jgi:alcohol dehydrogenase